MAQTRAQLLAFFIVQFNADTSHLHFLSLYVHLPCLLSKELITSVSSVII